ncbi:MAG TPA: hypothetical protein VLE47_01585 [Candidatus Saccharimonadales bacterium]|nr:hypothetical protein [Candidatus Saccharimonadales bacterium]
MDFTLIKKPAGWIPIAISIGALTLPWLWVYFFGPEPTGDEGGAAHLWQLLMIAQVIAIAIFAIIYLPKKPKQAILVLLIQIAFLIAAAIPVFILEH